MEKTSWITGDDGWLAYDADGNGQIEGLKELSPAAWVKELTGEQVSDWEGLAGYFDAEVGGGNGDGVFDARDSAWGDFGIWKDENEDGITQEGELKGLDFWGIEGISTDYADYAVNHVNNF